jgi:hypothetical protein
MSIDLSNYIELEPLSTKILLDATNTTIELDPVIILTTIGD